FASIYGTIKLLEPEEQARIKGFIINKFRGDVELLKPGIEMIEKMVNVPCLGVIPYERLVIDDEDSVTERWDEKREGVITIGVVRLRHISNFTDCTVFDMYPDVRVEYYENQRELHRAQPDLIVIPGSKNTIDDSVKLKESKLADEILAKNAAGIPVIGICGGYQILGKEIADPHGVESTLGSVEGLGLLNMRTVLEEEKTTTRVNGRINGDFLNMGLMDTAITGYEIHMGETEAMGGTKSFSVLEDGRADGGVSEDGTVMGTYLHGVFDNDAFREKLIGTLKKMKNIEADAEAVDFKAFKEGQYDLLAAAVEKNMDMKKLFEIIGV
ncbi:MAG: cobyric acid synthase, partial [Eubacterium sp.]